MSGKMNSTKDKKGEKIGNQVLKGLQLGNALQTRYSLIPKRGLSTETVGGIWDKTLGKKGKAIIRFDNGYKTQPHINIDPKGFPSRNNPHIAVPKGVVKSAQVLNTTLKYAGPILTVAAVAVDAYRLGSSIKDDVEIQKDADNILNEIDKVLEALHKKRDELKSLNDEKFPQRKKEIKEISQLIKYYEKLRKEVRLAKYDKVPCKSIKTSSSIAGGWLGGITGALGGGWAGTQTGALIGALFGPAGAAVGGFVGAVVGSICAGIGGGIGGSLALEATADFALETAHDNKYKNAETIKKE